MTVVVGIAHRGTVLLGADSLASDYHSGSSTSLMESKVWVYDGVAFGLAGSSREAQIIKHRLSLPARYTETDIAQWLVVDLADAVRQAKEDSGIDRKCEHSEGGSVLMIGVVGRLFVMDSEYGLEEREEGAIGAGAHVALGSLHTSRALWKSPQKRIDAALKAACTHNVFCGPPFTFVSV